MPDDTLSQIMNFITKSFQDRPQETDFCILDRSRVDEKIFSIVTMPD